MGINIKYLTHWSPIWVYYIRMWIPFMINVIIFKIINVDTYIKDKKIHKWFVIRGLVGPFGFLSFVIGINNLPLSESSMISD